MVEIPDTSPIGFLDNHWRRRRVTVYEHPTDAGMVITVGVPFDGGPPVVCEERKEGWERTISMWPRTAVYR